MLSQSKAHVLPGEGVDTQRFSPSPYINYSKNKTTFIFAGRMLWAKGLKELAEAAKEIKKQYPETVFQLLGFINPTNPNSVSKEQIEVWVKNGLFEYLGETENVIPFLQDADCIVLPSYREGISRLLLEAAALGKPSIATDVVGCREIIEHRITGFLCQPVSSEELRNAIVAFLKLTPNERKQMGLNARMKVEKEFDEKIVFHQYLQTLEKHNIK
jgi:glycosyltransferase involved in cell wall biosynthesis